MTITPTTQAGTAPTTISTAPQNTGVMTSANNLMVNTLGFKNNLRSVGIIDKIKPPNGIITENDYVWKVKKDGLNINRSTVRMMEIIEYQPTKFYDWVDGARKYLNRVVSVGVSAAGLGTEFLSTIGGGLITGAPTIFSSVTSGGLQSAPGLYYKNYAISRGVTGVLNLPMEEVVNYFATNPVCRYTVPFTNPEYLNVDGAYGWSSGGGNKKKEPNKGTSLGGTVANRYMEMLSKFTPSTAMKMVNWNPDNFQTPPDITTDFTLYNDTLEDLIKNIKFIYTLSAGTYWASIGTYHYSSNFYRIRCPNMFDYYYCGLHIEIQELGTKRLLHPKSIGLMEQTFGQDFLKEQFTHFPDGYSVKLEFKPMVPNNFNIYVNNLLKNNYEKQG